MLAYITPGEANTLQKLGGQKTMTPEGIPAYPPWDNYGVSKSDYDKGDFSKSTDKTVRDLATGKTGVSASQLAATNAAERKEAEKKAKEKKEKKEKDEAQKVEKKLQIEKKKKQKAKITKDLFDDEEDEEKSLSYEDGLTKVEKDKWDLDRFDKNKDGKLGWTEKNAKFQSDQRDKALQKTVISEMEVLGPYAKTKKQGGMHLGSGVPVDVWSNMTPKEKQYASVVQDYNIDKIKGLPKSKETGHQKYTHGDLTHYSTNYNTTSYRTGAYPIVKDPNLPSFATALLGAVKPDPVYESALASLHRLGTAKAGMSNEALGIAGMTDDEFNEFKVSNKNFPPGGGGGDGGPQDPCAGPNPPAYCFVGGKNQTDKEEEVEEEDWYMPLAFRAEGGRVGRAFGGMMGDDGRRAYGLGSIFKKITKPLKKIFKSPLGKAALLGLGAYKMGLIGGGKNFKLMEMITGKGGKGGLWNWAKKNPFAAISGASALSGLMADKDYKKYDDWGDNDDGTGLGDLNQYRQYGIQAFAEGGKPEAGLMDMGGMEKDYREDGGFVPIGGKEKADDVPARLSKNEFVMTADAVRGAGDGDIDKGAEVMYNMMKNLEAGGEVSEESQGLDGAREMFETSQRLEEVL